MHSSSAECHSSLHWSSKARCAGVQRVRHRPVQQAHQECCKDTGCSQLQERPGPLHISNTEVSLTIYSLLHFAVSRRLQCLSH